MTKFSASITKVLSVPAIMVLLGTGIAEARQLTVEEAVAAATASKGTSKHMRRAAAALASPVLRYTARKDGLNTVYVLSNGDNKGYMVLSADDVAMPVLGYADEGSFDPDNMPPAMEEWLRQYSDHIAYAASTGASIVAAPRNAAYEDIPEICKTRWNQDSPYSDQCPEIDGRRCLTGCVATAMAQVLKAHRWPEQPSGVATYNWEYTKEGSDQKYHKQLTLDMSTVTLGWDNMIDNYNNGAGNATQRAAVATLMKACGYAAFMGYGTGASGAVSIQAARGMVDYLGFDKGIRHLARQYFTLAEWTAMLYEELSQGYPLYYDGYGSGGHAFVVDGFSASDGYFHLNWGWGGMSNGFFQIITLDPGKQGLGGSTEGFYDGQSAFFKLRRPIEGSDYYPVIYLSGDFSVNYSMYGNNPIQFGNNQTFFYSQAIKNITVRPGVRLTDAEGNESYAWALYDMSTGTGGGINSYSVARSEFPTSGSYTVTPVFRSKGEIYDVHVSRDRVRELTLTCNGSKLSFKQVPCAPDFNVELSASRFYTRQTAFVTARITNRGDEYIGLMHARLTDASGNKIDFGSARVGFPKGSSQELEFSAKLATSITEGSYKLGLYDKADKLLCELQDIEVTSAPAGEMAMSISDVKLHNIIGGAGALSNPYTIHPDNVSISASIECTQGYYIDHVWARFNPRTSGYDRVDIPAPVLSIEAGETKPLEFSGDYTSALVPGIKYNVTFIYKDRSGTFKTIKGAPTLRVEILEPSGIDAVTTSPAEAFGIFPNPASSVVTISGDAPLESAVIYSITGAEVASHLLAPNDGTATIDVTPLAPGHYVIRITSAAGTAVKRLIKR